MLASIRIVWMACKNTDCWLYPRGSDPAGLHRGPGTCISKGFSGDADVGLGTTLGELLDEGS